MNCFYHQSVTAIGICKNCYKGLCEDCAIDVGNGLACKEHCESEVELLNKVLDRSKTQTLRLGSIYRRNAWLMGLLGTVFLIIAMAMLFVLPQIWLMNLLMFAFGVYLLVAAKMNHTESKKQEGASDTKQ